jgi:hypothetical protein
MPAQFSSDAQLLEGLGLRDMPVDQFALVAAANGIRGASKTVLNESFRGVRALKNDVAEKLWALWSEIEAMCQEFAPFALDLTDGERVHEWLKARRAGSVYSVVVPDVKAEQQ